MIRELTIDDLPVINDINYKFFYEGHYKDVAKLDVDNGIDYVMSWFESGNIPLGFFDGDKLCGFLILSIFYKLYDRPLGNLSHFVIDKEYRNKDISHKLIEKALELCDNANCIEVYAANTGIQTKMQDKLYVRYMRKYGFKPYSTLLKRNIGDKKTNY